jgi:methionyl-tRNA formyltransferase
METSHAKPSFPIGPFLDKEELNFENNNFFNKVTSKLPDNIISTVKSVNSQESIKIIKKIKPDFGIVFGTGKISEDVIKLFKDGLINVHRGIAEKYRGLDSDLWSIYHRDFKNIGVTIHRVDNQLDVGDILYQEKLSLDSKMEIYQLRYYTTVIATNLIIKSVNSYLQNKIKYFPQKDKGRYYSFMPLVLKEISLKYFNIYKRKLSI